MLIEIQLQEQGTEPIARSRLIEYAHRALRINHPGILNIFEVGNQKSGGWALIRQAGPLSWMYVPEISGKLSLEQIHSILFCIAGSLDYFYRAELRGGNVLSWGRFVRLILVREKSLALSIVPPSPTDIDLPLEKKYCALSPLTAPELLDSFAPTPAGDSFALAALAFHLYSGRPLFQMDDAPSAAQALRRGEYPSIGKAAPALSSNFAGFLQSALQLSPEKRPDLKTWKEMLAALNAQLLPQGIPEESEISFPRRQFSFEFANVLHGVPVQFIRLAQAGDVPMDVVMISQVEDGKYTLNLPGSDSNLPDYCPICGITGKAPVRFCASCGRLLI